VPKKRFQCPQGALGSVGGVQKRGASTNATVSRIRRKEIIWIRKKLGKKNLRLTFRVSIRDELLGGQTRGKGNKPAERQLQTPLTLSETVSMDGKKTSES